MYHIPLNLLLASCICASKSDFRRHLEYIKIQNGCIMSTDGHRAFRCEVDGLDKSLDLFIHPKYIKLLAQGVSRKHQCSDVIIHIKDNVVFLEFDNRKVLFELDDVGKFPDLDRVLPTSGFVDVMAHFHWRYLLDMQKMSKLLKGGEIIVKPTGKNSPALIDFQSRFNAVGIVMPIRVD